MHWTGTLSRPGCLPACPHRVQHATTGTWWPLPWRLLAWSRLQLSLSVCPTPTSSVERLRVSAADSWLELVLSVATDGCEFRMDWTLVAAVTVWLCPAVPAAVPARMCGCTASGTRERCHARPAWVDHSQPFAMAKLMNQCRLQYGKVLVSTSQLTRGVIAHCNITCSFTAKLLHRYNCLVSGSGRKLEDRRSSNIQYLQYNYF